MLRRDYEGQNCSIARALEIVGERWTLLIARDVLTDRLNRLVDEGILEKVRYSERPERFEYKLTAKGRDLHVALSGLRQWGDKYISEKPPTLLRRKADKKRVVAALVTRGTEQLQVDDVELVPGPGRTAAPNWWTADS